jgi:hypothetical protein
VAVSSLVSCSAAHLRYPPPSFLLGRRQNQNGGRQKGRNNGDQGKTDTTPVTSDKTPGSVGVHKLAPDAGNDIVLNFDP